MAAKATTTMAAVVSQIVHVFHVQGVNVKNAAVCGHVQAQGSRGEADQVGEDGDALVVRWLFRVDETVGGTRLKSTPSSRLATFIWRDGDWRLLSHANFNPPEEG